MSQELEIEKTYLLKHLPEGLLASPFKDIEDLYLPKGAPHAHLRIRKSGDFFTITKKEPVPGESASIHEEHNIKLTASEFAALQNCDCDRISKRRYYYQHNNRVVEVDFFFAQLAGLALADFEFSSKEEMVGFQVPDFCLADVTEEDFIAGGVLCRQSFASLLPELNRYQYQPIDFIS